MITRITEYLYIVKYVVFNDELLEHVQNYSLGKQEDFDALTLLEEFNERFNQGNIKLDITVAFEKKLLDICFI